MSQASFSVRSATRSDVAAIGSILNEWLIDPVAGRPLTADIEAHLQRIEAALSGAKPDAEFIVAESDRIVGVCGLQWTDIAPELVVPGEAAVEVVTAYVRDMDRGTGAGRALLDETERRARDHGFSTLLVVSGSRNREKGYPFWRKRYGEPHRWDSDYFAPGAERVVWKYDLHRA